ncbi:MAG TPA: S26 family signal peptidase, partial [Hyphomicrobiaceae bacterium]|nr:S26 family signal peptidase [Hyphomicrobiaceae bacterium]
MAAESSTASAISSHGPSSAGRDIRKATRVPRHRLSTLTLLTVASLAILFPRSGAPVLVWNASPSVPIGLYRVTTRPPLTGALAVIRLPEPLRILADTRGYLRKGALLIKPVAAAAGDTVCRHGALVAINGRVVARASTLDAARRSLPTWSGCFRLAADQIFV